MSTKGLVPPEIEQLATAATQTVLGGIRDETTEILRQSGKIVQIAEQNIADELDRHQKAVLEKLKEKDSKGWQLLIALVPTLFTIVLGALVWRLQIDTNQRIDRASKQLSTRLALTEEFYKRRFTIYDDTDRRMIQLLAAVRNLDRNPKDAEKKKQAAILLTQLNVSSRMNGFYMTKDVSDELANVWLTATELPQLNNGGARRIEELAATIKGVEAQMRKELLVNVESVDDQR